jgi:GGDEF domain-containing protein
MLGHYEIFDMAVILPDTSTEGSEVFATRVMESLMNPPILSPADGELLVAIGTATMPDDAKELGFLLAAAEKARNAAQQSAEGIVRYSKIPAKVGTLA